MNFPTIPKKVSREPGFELGYDCLESRSSSYFKGDPHLPHGVGEIWTQPMACVLLNCFLVVALDFSLALQKWVGSTR